MAHLCAAAAIRKGKGDACAQRRAPIRVPQPPFRGTRPRSTRIALALGRISSHRPSRTVRRGTRYVRFHTRRSSWRKPGGRGKRGDECEGHGLVRRRVAVDERSSYDALRALVSSGTREELPRYSWLLPLWRASGEEARMVPNEVVNVPGLTAEIRSPLSENVAVRSLTVPTPRRSGAARSRSASGNAGRIVDAPDTGSAPCTGESDPGTGVEPPRYASIAFAEPRRFAGRVTYETASDPINATGSKDKAPSPAR
jgi:hypothetical protein